MKGNLKKTRYWAMIQPEYQILKKIIEGRYGTILSEKPVKNGFIATTGRAHVRATWDDDLNYTIEEYVEPCYFVAMSY